MVAYLSAMHLRTRAVVVIANLLLEAVWVLVVVIGIAMAAACLESVAFNGSRRRRIVYASPVLTPAIAAEYGNSIQRDSN